MSTGFVHLPNGTDLPAASEVGGKAHNLARLASVSGVRVPRWFAVRAKAFDELVLRGRPLPADAGNADSMRREARTLAFPDDLRQELENAFRSARLEGASVAVRSSATAEDAAAASFAGQFESILGVRVTADLDEVWDAIRRVWASTFSSHAVAYARGAVGTTLSMGVVIQELVAARAAGVAFSIDPVTGDPGVCVVSAVFGLGESLVSGESTADTVHVRAASGVIIRSVIASKDHALLRGESGGTVRADVPGAARDTPALTEEQSVAIARTARTIAEQFGVAQDIEWAIGRAESVNDLAPRDDEPIVVLQARPVTTAVGERCIWDNSNIIESYGGVTTPLTFSFARCVYEQVYRQFCALLGVAPETIDAHERVFANMLGLIRGRIYYNLLNWYRVLALLPGYDLNREFMERMMGVRERLTEPPPPAHAGARWRDAGRVARMLWSIVREHGRIDREVASFFQRVERALAPVEDADLGTWSANQLVGLYRRLEKELLLHWRAPLVNDFFAMIWFGILGRLVERWMPTAPATLANDLLVGEGQIISTEPARRLMTIASLVRRDPAVRAIVESGIDERVILDRLRVELAASDVVLELDAYLRRFGDRCIGELKLETITAKEDPSFVIRMVAAYSRQQAKRAEHGAANEQDVRAQAEADVRGRLGGLRRTLFFWVLAHARRRVRDRENLRFERTRVFGAVRRIFRSLGDRFVERGWLSEPRQIFNLTIDEVFHAVDGTNTQSLGDLAMRREEEFAAYDREPSPPDRFETFGTPGVLPATPRGSAASLETAELRGIGCCPGIIRAPVRIVRDPSEAGDLEGRILVAERTDPGWTLLFPTASGLLVQRGSLLSHSAIVAREVGLPCIVAIPDLMDTLRDGEMVEMDGATGAVRRIATPEQAA